MSKAGLVIAVCVTIVTGCSSVDSPPSEVKTTEKSAVLVPIEPAPIISESAAPSAPPEPAMPRRSLTPNEIRRMQVRLRALGLDPGPVDGLAGAKTQSAVKHFHLGCGQLKNLLDSGQFSTLAARAPSQLPSRRETLTMQHQLRDAGFDPGPVDGIFGAKIKTIFTHLLNGCPAAQEFVAVFDQTEVPLDKLPTTAVKPPEPPCAPQTIALLSSREGEDQSGARPIALQPKEEIRVLQLRLRDAGYDPGPVDGLMGPKTKWALQQMQEASQQSAKPKHVRSTKIITEY